jgi:uncharacterized membrane protein
VISDPNMTFDLSSFLPTKRRKDTVRWLLLAICLSFLVVGSIAPVGAQSKSLFWRRWDVLINNVDTAANHFDVTESYDIDFSGTFRFGSAVIPLTNLDDIRGVQVSENGQNLRASCSGSTGTYCVENTSDGLSITYYFFQPITNGSATFDVSYTVYGALRIYSGGDQLWWIAIPSDHYGFSIGSSTITVQMPDSYGPREGVDPVETYGAPGTVNVRGTTITATANGQITGDESFEIRVQYPHNPAAVAPGWQGNFDQQRTYEENTKPLVDLGLIALSLLLTIGGLMGIYGLWYTRGRDPKVGPVPQFLTGPPTDLRPAVVGTLLDEKADLRDVISTIVDLARRGYLVMEEQQETGLFGIGTSSKFTFKRTDKALNDLRKFEQRMMSSLFRGGMERSLDSLRNSFYAVIPQLQNDLYDALVEDGLFTTKPSTTRAMWSSLGGVLLAIAFVFGFFALPSLENVSEALICLPLAIGLVGFIAMIVGQHMPAKTRKGAEDAAKWTAFREYLHNLEKYSDVQDAAQHFDDYLPYAIAFGFDRSWVRRFSKLQTVPIPVWYYPTYLGGPWHRGYTAGTPLVRPSALSGGMPGDLAHAGSGGMSLNDVSGKIGGGLENISSGLSNMLESAGRVMTSRPQQSGGSGRWSSGGRSWSGGGGFRGGGSGGGRRGFG